MDIFEQYDMLAQENRYEEALPVIKDIVSRDKSCDVSWFNFAVTLEKLKRFDEALNAYRRSYELNNEDKGIQFHIFRLLAQLDATELFTGFAEKEILETPEVLRLLEEYPEFQAMTQNEIFQVRMRQFRN